MLRAALRSRSCSTPQCGQTHRRSASARCSFLTPQSWHNWVEGQKRSTATTCVPYHCPLYASCQRSVPMLASRTLLASLVLARPFTLRSSVHTALSVLISEVV